MLAQTRHTVQRYAHADVTARAGEVVILAGGADVPVETVEAEAVTTRQDPRIDHHAPTDDAVDVMTLDQTAQAVQNFVFIHR